MQYICGEKYKLMEGAKFVFLSIQFVLPYLGVSFCTNLDNP